MCLVNLNNLLRNSQHTNALMSISFVAMHTFAGAAAVDMDQDCILSTEVTRTLY